MARFPDVGAVLMESGASIPTTYTGAGLGEAFPLGGSTKARFVATLNIHASSSLTTFTVKLQGFDNLATPPACDFFSTRNDNGTAELEHAFTATAGSKVAFAFSADLSGFDTVRVVGKATGASHASDVITVTCVAF